ncbi:hypothetical protein N7457_007932 [Penicillium paradoxum]|uniref:uncharacterized protein n=1 Tax=Penicillium paradoxum TaxID=176176 RepID=UPI002547EF9E|nr:uncharacterized protein N7457_007932 [Penicillium paradoxum]KAJ5773036.1 hypothetical protein N7457_007932 [Penicillium paradoxum]
MSNPSGVSIADECIDAFNELRSGPKATKPNFIIYKISDDNQRIIVEESSTETDYKVLCQKLTSAVDKDGNLAPRYAVYDMEYDLGSEGKRSKIVFIHWGPCHAPLKLCMLYACSMAPLKRAIAVQASVHADSLDELEWTVVLKEVSGGKA